VNAATLGSPFADILRVAVERTPQTIGAAFAARDGEMVDYFALNDPNEWALITAHYGVVLSHVQAALHTCHYGEADIVLIENAELDIIVYPVDEGYYALMALTAPAPLAIAMSALEDAVVALRAEMG
jgi:hypothetical protein